MNADICQLGSVWMIRFYSFGVTLTAAPLPAGEDASLPLSSGGSYQILVNNVFYFSQRVVDKLWQGMFNKDSKLVVDFIVQLIGQVRKRPRGDKDQYSYVLRLSLSIGKIYSYFIDRISRYLKVLLLFSIGRNKRENRDYFESKSRVWTLYSTFILEAFCASEKIRRLCSEIHFFQR